MALLRAPAGGWGLCLGRLGAGQPLGSLVAAFHAEAPLAEYTATPAYPVAVDLSRAATRRRQKEEWHARVTGLPTVEQKAVELNMPKYYGHWSCHVHDTKPMLLGADFCQFATRTHVAQGLPQDYYGEVWDAAMAAAGKVTDQVEQLIDLNYNVQLNRRIKGTPATHKRRQTQNFLAGLHRVLAGALQDTPHIRDATVDLKPRIEAFWFLGSIPPDRMLRKTRANLPWVKELEHEPIDRPIQGSSSPFLGVRVADGLPAVVGRDDTLATSADIPPNILDPRAFGFKFKHKHATTVTGYWPGEMKEYGHLFLHTWEIEEAYAARFGAHNLSGAFTHKAVISSFVQAHAHAAYLGFGPVTEMTYPLVQQSAYTDGHRWTLGLYQLNTCALHSERPVENTHNNILWLSEEQQLFEGVDDGGVKGLNTSLLASLLAMYLKRGVPNADATPYLALKHVSQHPAREEYREEFHNTYLRLCSNRPRSRLKPEMYLWEKIYKVDHNTRPLDTPRRFFEDTYRKKDPGQRRLDDYSPVYIPKDKRIHKRIKFKPRLDSKHLYKYDQKLLFSLRVPKDVAHPKKVV